MTLLSREKSTVNRMLKYTEISDKIGVLKGCYESMEKRR